MSEREQIPAGAIENGREHFRRLAEHYDFECEGGPLHNCTDFISARQCFEHLTEYVQARARIAEQEKRELVEAAYREGHFNGRCGASFIDEDDDWIKSKACALLAKREGDTDE